MSCEKVELPPVYTTEAKASPSGVRNKKKLVLISATVVIVAALVITGALVGVYLNNQAELQIIQFSLQFQTSKNESATQNVASNPSDNSVTYHVTTSAQDIYVVQDFSRGIEMIRIQTSSQTTCFVSVLNATAAMNPSQITGPESMTGNAPGAGSKLGTPYSVSNTPIADTSFLNTAAANLCHGVSVYWATPDCAAQLTAPESTTSAPAPLGGGSRKKRTLYNEGYFNGLACIAGCCVEVCACGVVTYEYINGAQHTCQFYYYLNTCSSVYRSYYLVRNFATPPIYCPYGTSNSFSAYLG